MHISETEINKKNDKLICSANVRSQETYKKLWYEIEAKFENLVSDSSDAFLVGLIIPAMISGEDIFLSGAISERLFYNLNGRYQSILQHIIPSLNRINIYPKGVHSITPSCSGVATGFSGGIDSYSVLADHHYSEVTNGFKLTHLLFNNVGSHGNYGLTAERLFRERFSQLKPLVEYIGLPFICVNSNLDEFYQNNMFQQTHTLRNTSVALLLQKGIRRYLYASTYNYKETYIGEAYDMAYSDPYCLPVLSTDVLDAFSVGSEYTRVEKTIRVAGVKDSYDTLDVCINTNTAQNCSKCLKCMRTLLTLEIAGMIKRYENSFDLNIYKQYRNKYIAEVLNSNNSFLKEILEFAEKSNFPIPIYSKLYSKYLKMQLPTRKVLGLPRRFADKFKL